MTGPPGTYKKTQGMFVGFTRFTEPSPKLTEKNL